MTSKKDTRSSQQLADLTDELAALSTMSSRDLARRLAELTGQTVRTNNRDYLMRAVATVIQERAEPYPKDGIARRVAELGDEVPLRWRMRAKPVQIVAPAKDKRDERALLERDPRLPAPGTRLTRRYRGQDHEVEVGEDSFTYQGRRYKSLSHVARTITQRQWNGFQFFGLTQGASEEAAP
ncbi:MAG: DUF2924 domain-containing protein [Kofleriaceae bacterium]|nr:DUF2924 domain-containing protein [Kofleriaceae bacterium]